jgi:hypothetical protein
MGELAPKGSSVAFLVCIVELESVSTVEGDGLLEDFGVWDISQVFCRDGIRPFALTGLPPVGGIRMTECLWPTKKD